MESISNNFKTEEQLQELNKGKLLAMYRVEGHKCRNFEKKYNGVGDYLSEIEAYNNYVSLIKLILDKKY